MAGRLMLKVGLSAAAVLGASLAGAQYGSLNVSLRARISLTSFGASAGNDCWGYVSPSGREYALMGCNNKTAFVEVTNPGNPDYFASVSHPSSTWSDIKVFGRYAYVVSEASGTGIQVIDLVNIDSHVVTLVNTVAAPDRSHNIAINEQSGFLYTLGSRGGSGTTTCWSLANPANPVQVGPASLTSNYMHDATIVNYTSGPYAGKEIFFGLSEGRGVDIYDVTNKNSPTLIKRMPYPDIGYCHQGWLSEDKKTLYVGDEMDETGFGFTTRTLVFDVQSLENGVFVTSFTSGESAIDHNQYVRSGFVFQANYRSGLRIFDSNDNPFAPVQTGFFDTYPSNNATGYDGAWSTFPYFPSGTVIVSDINRGLFVLDPTVAVTRTEVPTAFLVQPGLRVQGGLAQLIASDDNYLVMSINNAADEVGPDIQLRLDATSPSDSPKSMSFILEARSEVQGVNQTIQLYDWVAGQYEQVDSRFATLTDSTVTSVASGSLTRFVQPGTRKVRARFGWTNVQADIASVWKVWVDQAIWRINP